MVAGATGFVIIQNHLYASFLHWRELNYSTFGEMYK